MKRKRKANMGEQERAEWLALAAEPNDTAARNKLVERYLPLADAIAWKYHKSIPPYIELDDVKSAARLALIACVGRFDLTRDCAPKTFLAPRLTGACLDYLRSLDPVSRTTRERINRGVEQERTTFSLDAIVGYRDQALCSQIVIQKQRHNHIADAVDLFAGLSQRERLIVLLYYGEELTQAEVAESLGISPARVAQQMQQIREGIRCRVQAAA